MRHGGRTTSRRPIAGDVELPPFCGGWVGWLSSEFAASLEERVPRPERDEWGVPDATFDDYALVVAFDHAAQRLFVIARTDRGAADYDSAQALIDRLSARDPHCGHGDRPQHKLFHFPVRMRT